MKRIYLLLLFASFFIGNAQVNWRRGSIAIPLYPTGTQNFPAWMGTTSTERGMAALGDRMYVLSRKTTPHVIKVINGETGADVKDLSYPLTGSVVSGGTFVLNDVEVSTNGAILACNMTTATNTSAFKIYKWDSEDSTAPSLFLSFTNAGATADNLRLGDYFSVTGDIAGDAVIMAAGQVAGTSGTTSVHKVVRWKVTGGTLNTTPTIITLSLGNASTFISAVPVDLSDTSDFYIKLAGRGLVKCNSTGTIIESTTVLGGSATDIKYIAAGTKKYIAAWVPGGAAELGRLLDVTGGLSTAFTVASTPQLGTTANSNTTGGVGVKVTVDPLGLTANTVTLYVLGTNNGISATTLVNAGVNFPAAPTAVAQTVCSNPGTVAKLVSPGVNSKWYDVAVGGTALDPATAVTVRTYYTTQTAGGMESLRTSVNVTAITPSTTTGSETVSICGSSYTWALDGKTYTSSGIYTKVDGCNTATLTLSLTPAPNAGTNGTLTVCAGTEITEADLFAVIGNHDLGGTWSNDGLVYTYTVNPTSPCATAATATVTVTIQALPNAGTDGTLNVIGGDTPTESQLFAALTGADAGGTWSNDGFVYTYTVAAIAPCTGSDTSTVTVAEAIPASFSVCSGSTISSIVGTTSLKFYKDAKPATTPLVGTTALKATITYFVSHSIGGVESSRVLKVITVNALPAAPGAITGTATPGTLVGTPSTTTYSISPVTGATSYEWTAPQGVNIIGANNGTTVTVNFAGISAGIGAIGNLSVKAINASGCFSAAKTLALTKVLPAAPAAIVATDASLPVPAGKSAAALKSFAQYMGTPIVLTLTATPSPTATSYAWELPAGVTQLSGGTSNVITVNFEGVTYANTTNYQDAKGISTNALRIGVKSVNGVGSSVTANTTAINPSTVSTAKLLTLTATKPAPSKPSMTNGVTTVAVADISKFVGTTTAFTLTASPSPLASSYDWELPTGVSLVSGTLTSRVITVHFNNVAAGAKTLYVGVKAVNGMGSSSTTNVAPFPATTYTYLKLAAVLPAVAKITGASAFKVCKDGSENYTITPSPLVTSYVITAPAGSVVTSASNLTNTSNVLTTSDLAFTVKYNNLASPKPVQPVLSIVSVNGVGSSLAGSFKLTSTGACSTARSSAAKAVVTVSATEVYPNPVSNDFNIDVTATKAGALSIAIYSLDNNLVVSPKAVQLQAGVNTINENISSLNKGIYIVQLVNSSNGEVITKKLVKN